MIVTEQYTKIGQVTELIHRTPGLDYEQKQSLVHAALHLPYYDVAPVETLFSGFQLSSAVTCHLRTEDEKKSYREHQLKATLARIGQFLYDHGYIEEEERDDGVFGTEIILSLKVNRPEKEDKNGKTDD